jgi:hypothetical protein
MGRQVRKRAKKAHAALYGTVAIERRYCPVCDSMAFVIDRTLQCCEMKVEPNDDMGVVREVESDGCRRKPSAEAQKKILAAQDERCFYCDQKFGSIQLRGHKVHRLVVEWDHLIPFSYTQSCHDEQFVAACDVCNGVKSAQMYATLEAAQADLAARRATKGWSF